MASPSVPTQPRHYKRNTRDNLHCLVRLNTHLTLPFRHVDYWVLKEHQEAVRPQHFGIININRLVILLVLLSCFFHAAPLPACRKPGWKLNTGKSWSGGSFDCSASSGRHPQLHMFGNWHNVRGRHPISHHQGRQSYFGAIITPKKIWLLTFIIYYLNK